MKGTVRGKGNPEIMSHGTSVLKWESLKQIVDLWNLTSNHNIVCDFHLCYVLFWLFLELSAKTNPRLILFLFCFKLFYDFIFSCSVAELCLGLKCSQVRFNIWDENVNKWLSLRDHLCLLNIITENVCSHNVHYQILIHCVIYKPT